ncbi:carbohydrate binding family 9 domain-containing protein [Candidatus Aminicenantes bacterium AC-335-K20]|jgi:hypothetical protein|nr:carbohydrate binding family 9 domain-containing protein [SCandidatus Aminicenantes bacterium Aminicenantia_JdfR_composite]MCP2596250.1 carbohydrate binding family 9 domain-containing protein [Candidatus Aminicenantes bacterium AC-335-G13]MCP2597825.1 carbohydrate binding family 9 domain-containing protein [Candidatus Aminicenantes bacterium AC-335-L06]MCP2606145.1 carbohydrate binding family 9 domain-containing protein [Candidatus Aminicenantes bacterium AC-708-I09]MCP2619567.1 carbohydrate 
MKYKLYVLILLITFTSLITYSNEKYSIPKAEVYLISNDQTIKLDGKLNESPWENAPSIGSLTMVEPKQGVSPTEKTVVKVLATSQSIYFGIICYDSNPDKIVSYTMQRDADLRGEDHVKIVLDTFLNGRTGYVFAVNPNGARYDALIEREGEGENKQWDGIWEASARRFEQGWSVEIYIPIKTLRFRTGLTEWGFNIERRIQRLLETDRWASPNRNYKVTHISRGGRLVSLPSFKQGMGMTIRPYILGKRIKETPNLSVTYTPQTGLDIFKNFGGDVTGLISINTDFAETEVDTRQINLTRFPLFFPEKRTFFLEGSDIFNFGIGLTSHRQKDIIPFFSRRIGLVKGQAVPLDLSIKATGSIGRFNFGILDSLTREVENLAPKTNLFAFRGFQNIWKESKIGFLITMGDPLGRYNSWLVGVDFIYKTTQFRGDKNFLFGIWGLINNRQDLGKDRYAFGFKIDYPNDLWDISLTFKRIGADFDPSLGFVPWKGIYKINYATMYKPRPEISWLRQIFYQFFTSFVMDLNGKIMQWRIFTAPINWKFESGDRVEFNIVPQMEVIPESFNISPDVFVSPGEYKWTRYRIEFETADKRKFKTKFTWWFGGFYNGHMNQYQATLAWRPSHYFNISFEGEKNSGELPSGLFDINLARARINVFISPNFQVLSFFQYDNITRSLGMNTRLRWTYRSLLDVFIVYNRNWIDTNRGFIPDLNQFMIKIQYSWRY